MLPTRTTESAARVNSEKEALCGFDASELVFDD
jgi:hypothetical protein